VIVLREEQYESAVDLMRVNSESISNEIDESEMQEQKLLGITFHESTAKSSFGAIVDVFRHRGEC
jgi:hypothetical protein